jgi:hypothetical protein
MRAKLQGQTQLAASITEYAKIEVKLDQAQAVLQTTVSPIVKVKMAEKVEQLESEKSQVKSQVEKLRSESGAKTASGVSVNEAERKSLDNWLASVRSQAVNELAVEIDDM